MASDLRVGVAGLGSASAQILPCFDTIDGVVLAAAADVRPQARDAFTKAYDLPAYETVDAMCQSPDLDVVWIATPNTLHCEHVISAAEGGKHIICEKPMAISLDECDRMIDAAERAGVQLMQGHSKVFDAPIRAMHDLVASGRLGQVTHIDSWNFNNWLERPRLASEVDTTKGGGLVFRQGPHQVDLVRHICNATAVQVRGIASRWNPHFDTEGNFSALLQFDNGAVANLTLNGYGYFDSTELIWGIGEGGGQIDDPRSQPMKPRRTGPMEAEEKYDYVAKLAEGGPLYPRGKHQPFFGLTVVSCEHGAIRQSPDGLFVYSEMGCEEVAIEPGAGRASELIEMRDALAQGRAVFPDGIWGRASLEICLAILESSKQKQDVTLTRQARVNVKQPSAA